MGAYLAKNKVEWIDIQMVTPVSESFGGVECARSEFLQKVKGSLQRVQKASWWQRGIVLK